MLGMEVKGLQERVVNISEQQNKKYLTHLVKKLNVLKAIPYHASS